MPNESEFKPKSVAVFTKYSNSVGVAAMRYGGGSKLSLPGFIVNFSLQGEREAWDRLIEWFVIMESELYQWSDPIRRYTTLRQIELNDILASAFTENIPEVVYPLLAKFSLIHPPTKNTGRK